MGLALIYAWSWLLYWGGPFSLRNHTMELANTRWAGHIVACALVIGVIAFVACRRPRGRRLMGGIRWAGLNHTMELANTRWAGHIVACALVIGVIAFVACRRPRGRRLMGGIRWAGLVGALGGTALALWLVVTPPSAMESFLLVAFISGVLTGIGEGCLLCLWCTITSSLGMRVALAYNVVSMAASGLLFLLCNAIPPVAGLAVGLLCPLVSSACSFGHHGALAYNVVSMAASGLLFLLCNAIPPVAGLAVGLLCPLVSSACSFGHHGYSVAFSGNPADDVAEKGDAPQKAPAQPRGLSSVTALFSDRSFLMLMAIALVFGLSCGFVLASFEVIPKADYWTASYGVVIGTILAAALAFLTAFVLKMDAWQLVFQTSLPLMAAAYLLYPYGGAFAVVSPGLHTLGFQYFFVTFWSILGSKQLRHDVPAACSVAIGLFAVNAGQAVGLGAWNLLCVGIDPTGLHIAVSIAVFALLVAAVTFEHPAFGWGTVRPGEAPKSGAGNRDLPYETIVARIRSDYGLSPREHDVCLLLGRGRNRQFVADELGISLETAKTHATNVYRKLSDYGLSPREHDVCLLLGRGRNRQFVADELGISLETAKTHATNVYRKLSVHSQQELLDVIEMTQDTLGRERKGR